MSISLEKSVRTCKVDTGYANKIESARFLDPSQMVCPIWNGIDTSGRTVCESSYWIKQAGCNSASDRINVENDLRPQYVEYISLSLSGIDGSMYDNNTHGKNAQLSEKFASSRNDITGNFGMDFKSNVIPACSSNSYADGMAQQAATQRSAASSQVSSRAHAMRH